MEKRAKKRFVEYGFLKLGKAIGFCAEMKTWAEIADVFQKESAGGKITLTIGYKTRFGAMHRVSFFSTMRLWCLIDETNQTNSYTVLNPNMIGVSQQNLDELKEHTLKHYGKCGVWETKTYPLSEHRYSGL